MPRRPGDYSRLHSPPGISPVARQRTFLAVEISGPARLAAVELQRRLDAAAGPGVKWVEAANLHVTLMFLGEVDGRDLVEVCKIVAAAADAVPPFGLRLTGVGAFPNGRRPKTVFAGVSDGAAELGTLQRCPASRDCSRSA